MGKEEIARYKQFLLFFRSVSKRSVLETRKNQRLFGKGLSKNLTLSLLMTTQEAFVVSVDQDQTVQNLQSDL